MEEKESSDLSDSFREFNNQRFFEQLSVEATTELLEGLRVVSASYEGRHYMKGLPQDPVVRVVVRGVLAQVLKGRGRR